MHPPLREERETPTADTSIPFTEEELTTAAKSLKRNKAPGPDGVPVEVLKLVTENRPNTLHKLYNVCIAKDVFPNQWKLQKLTPVTSIIISPSLYVG